MTGTDAFSMMIEAACETAIRRTLGITDVSPRRLLAVKEVAIYLSISSREVYNLLANKELPSVHHGRRVMIDIRDLEAWIASKKM